MATLTPTQAMHLLDRFAATCGSAYAAPPLDEAFFPLPFEAYITINQSASHANQNYDYWPDVIREILPLLQGAKINIVEIGDRVEKVKPLEGAYDLRGTLNIKQMSHVIKNSALHISGDSFCADIANLTGTKNCQIFGATPSYLTSPQWHPELVSLFSPSVAEASSLLFPVENKAIAYKFIPPDESTGNKLKGINSITPESISTGIIKAMGLSFPSPLPTTLTIGDKYHLPVIDVVPDHLPKPGQLSGNLLHFRLDYNFNESYLAAWAQDNRQLVIVTNKEVNLELLHQHKQAINQIAYEVTMETRPAYIRDLIQIGLPIFYFSRTSDKHLLQRLRLKLIDWIIEQRRPLTKKDLDIEAEIDYNGAYYMSSRTLLSNGKCFPSKEAWIQDLPLNQQAYYPVPDTLAFWEEQAHFRILQPHSLCLEEDQKKQ